ncbi:hypothetical protein [Amantichitinum ursilacus]|uniref:Uncharacterized protein n=1 Tax=Amantichitinum ursilacus TaxID=857265 RepID=A0A0N0GQ15_9NEIS|nr:hypothetical protein [Amantichitinum ursilacus]KPC54314.1 hypothetical protein WG78_06680 [Amantichitinum ursilacus]
MAWNALITAPRALALQLSDAEAGTPRQWYWLEIAALQTPLADPPRLPLWLVRRFGPLLAWPVLRASRLPGAALYALHARSVSRISHQSAQDAALAIATVPMLLAGFNLLTPTLAFISWLLLLGGLIWQSVRAGRTPRGAAVRKINPDEDDAAAQLPGPEEIVGLQALLISVGAPPATAARLLAALAEQADTVLPDLLSWLPDLAPAPPDRRTRMRAAWLGWLLIMLPTCLGWVWLPRWPALALCVLWSAGVLAFWQRRSAALLVMVSAVLAYALGRLGHGG